MCAVLAAVLCSTATAGDGLLVGVSEDSMKWSPERGKLAARHMYRLGVSAVRVTIRWSPGQSAPRGPTLVALRRAIRTAGGRRLVLAVYSRAHGAPQIARRRRQYCGFVGRLLLRAGRARDVVIWNEPNSGKFWRPQYTPDGRDAAATAYEALLEECWDELHALRRDVNVIAASAPRGNDDPDAERPSHSPLQWYRGHWRGLSEERSRATDLRHGRPQPVPEYLRRGTLGDASGRDDRSRRLREAHPRPDGRVLGNGAAGAGRRALDLVHGGRLSDPYRSSVRHCLRRQGERLVCARRRLLARATSRGRWARRRPGLSALRRGSPGLLPAVCRAPSSTSCSQTSAP